MDKTEALKEYTKIVVETDEKNPITIATITNNETVVADGYRVRLTPKMPDKPEDKQEICNLLAETLRATRNFWDVTGIAYSPKEERVTVQFLNGEKSVNVAADSGAAMIKDIMNHI